MYDFGDGYKAIAPPREMLPMDPGSERAIVSTPIDSGREVALQVLRVSVETAHIVSIFLVLNGKLTPQRVHPRDFVQVTHSEAPERFWVQVVKHKDGVVWGIVDNSLICVDWPHGKKIRFSMCRVFDVYAGEA